MATSAQQTKDIIPEPATLVARARAMIPALKARAAQGEADRKIPDDTIREFKEAGFFDILKPKRWGGFEMEPQVFYEVQMAIAEGCMSSAWVLGVVGVHPLQLGLFPLKAQEDVWGKDASVLISSSYQPVGKVEKTDGDFYLSGQWSFSSGCQHCDWVFAGALVFGPEGTPPEYRTFLVPRSDYQIVDTWNTFGLKATGSHDVKIDHVFVPEHRTHKAMDGYLCRNPGQEANPGDIFKLPWAAVFTRAVSTASIGATQDVLNSFLEIAKTRVSTNTGMATKGDPFALSAAANAAAEIASMKATLFKAFDDMMAVVRAGKDVAPEDRVFYKYQASRVARRCADIADELLLLAGAKGIFNDNPIVRPWLDLKAGRAHIANNQNLAGLTLGGSFLGAPVMDTFL
ncbi:MAG TPA: acyl-CoA dehydrogenase family protein [Alphaproteobacteria bacterium]|nr:acyl-CoA dehydrogenase family protein [Alphaproteobacteria bacterium]